MCRVCASSLITDRLTSGVWPATPSRRQFIAYAVSAGAAVAATAGRQARAAADGADAIFRDGAIYPMSAGGRTVEALAIGGGKILAAGQAADISTLAHGSTKIVDLQGRALFPGFIDPHHHTVVAALVADLLVDVGYRACRTRADALSALKAAAAKTPPGQWIRAGYYDNLLQGGDLSMSDLDAVSTEHPVFVWYVNGHTAAANAMAFKLAKITEDVGELPGGGRFGRGPDGNLNGLIYEEPAILRFIAVAAPPMSPELMASAVVAHAKRAAAAGNTTLHEPGTIKPEWVEPLAKLSNTLAVRMSASLPAELVEAGKAFASLGPGSKARKLPESRFSLYGVKFWADGSLQQETAALTNPYLNSANKGATDFPETRMAEICRAAKEAGWPILIHCQGDAATDDALEAIEAAYGANPETGLNVVQHATMARPDQLDRMKRLGVEPTFLPDLLNLYGAAYCDQILGRERAESIAPMGACVKAGISFSLHTDAPVSPAGPLRLVQIAVTRRCEIDNSVIGPDQAITVDEALRAITIHGARHVGLEDTIGTLETSKEADLTILESDPFKTDPDKISAIKVSETWVAGEKAFG
jgi:predicted amidohydrolase YtcJ